MRTAMITGAAQGIGRAAALRLAREGVARFVLIDRQRDKLDAVAAELVALGASADPVVLDLCDVEALLAAVAVAVARAGTVDILVNAAGTTARGGLADTTPATFDAIFALNVRAPVFLMQAVAPAMPRGGVIVNICSMVAYGGPPFLLPYSASKAALVCLTRNVANSLKHDGVRVFGINLGWTDTPAERETQTAVHGLPADWTERVGAGQPFGRMLTAEDPAALIAFLASPGAAMMTGAIIDLDQFVMGTTDAVIGSV